MKGFLGKLKAALKAMSAMMTRLVLVPVKAADGVLTWAWEAVANRNAVDTGGPTEWEQIEADMGAQHPDLDAVAEAMRVIGTEARIAAREMIAFGEVRSVVRPGVRSWVAGLDRHSLEALVEAGDAKVGRHYAGVETMTDRFGEPIVTPDPERDERRAREKARRRREFEESVAPKPAPKAEPLGGPAAPLLGFGA